MPEAEPPDPLQQRRREQAERQEMQQWYRLTGLGVEFIVAVLALGGVGWYLDGLWQTRPWLMLAGGGIGFAAGLWLMIRAAMKMF